MYPSLRRFEVGKLVISTNKKSRVNQACIEYEVKNICWDIFVLKRWILKITTAWGPLGLIYIAKSILANDKLLVL